MTTNHDSREAMRAGARKGAVKLARQKRQTRNVQVGTALRDHGGWMNVSELSVATGRTAAVVRAALKERVEEGRALRAGKQYKAVGR